MNNKPVSECNKEEEMKKIAETWDKEASKGLEKDWREEFRTRLIELDDCNTHMNNIHEPIKGDIYFDGIEIEQFISNLISQIESSAIERVVRDLYEISRKMGVDYLDIESYAKSHNITL